MLYRRKDLSHYLDFHICAAATFFAAVSLELVTTDFVISSDSDAAGKFKMSEERNESVAALDTLALLGLYAPPPRSTCRCASRRSRPRRDSA